jgi:ribosomal protein S18 acetylase RimI-like enzyme
VSSHSEPASITIRVATADDVDSLLALWAIAAENASRPRDSAEAVRSLLARDPEACLVACADGQLVGSLIAGWDGWRAHLYRLAVHPDARRRGIGRALLDAGARRLQELGATRLDAMVLDDNELGQSLWRRAGYKPQANWRRWVKPVS